MFLKHIDLTTALRPSYLPDEVLLFVQDNVGLYEGSEPGSVRIGGLREFIADSSFTGSSSSRISRTVRST